MKSLSILLLALLVGCSNVSDNKFLGYSIGGKITEVPEIGFVYNDEIINGYIDLYGVNKIDSVSLSFYLINMEQMNYLVTKIFDASGFYELDSTTSEGAIYSKGDNTLEWRYNNDNLLIIFK